MKTALNVGCGIHQRTDSVNLDAVEIPGVDVVHDLDVFPWPFEDGIFEAVHATQVYEHVREPVGFVVEAHRVLKVGGVLHIVVPHYKSENSFTDPTHLRHCTERTWDYWCQGAPLNAQFGQQFGAGPGGAVFEKLRVERYGDDIYADLRKV